MDGILLITNASAGSNEEQAVADAVDVLDKVHDVEVAATENPEELAAVLDLGVGAQASKKAETWKPRLGKVGYAVGALTASLRPDFLDVDVFVDGEEVT